jgi:uncharacterized protein (TIGR02646 family)
VIPLRRPPAAALSPETTAALEARAQAVAAAGTSAVPEWTAFTSSPAYQEVRGALAAAANEKCAYCESHAPEPELDHVQPKRKHPELAFAWDNLLPACPICNRKKGTKGGLGPDGTPRLIDPSAEDPGASLVWDRRGFVKPDELTDDHAHTRAKDTIRALDLHRQSLLDGQRIARNEALFALIRAEEAAADFNAATSEEEARREEAPARCIQSAPVGVGSGAPAPRPAPPVAARGPDHRQARRPRPRRANAQGAARPLGGARQPAPRALTGRTAAARSREPRRSDAPRAARCL